MHGLGLRGKPRYRTWWNFLCTVPPCSFWFARTGSKAPLPRGQSAGVFDMLALSWLVHNAERRMPST